MNATFSSSHCKPDWQQIARFANVVDRLSRQTLGMDRQPFEHFPEPHAIAWPGRGISRFLSPRCRRHEFAAPSRRGTVTFHVLPARVEV
jgi:hypothetical protein